MHAYSLTKIVSDNTMLAANCEYMYKVSGIFYTKKKVTEHLLFRTRSVYILWQGQFWKLALTWIKVKTLDLFGNYCSLRLETWQMQ